MLFYYVASFCYPDSKKYDGVISEASKGDAIFALTRRESLVKQIVHFITEISEDSYLKFIERELK